jgi:hypothetical protein
MWLDGELHAGDNGLEGSGENGSKGTADGDVANFTGETEFDLCFNFGSGEEVRIGDDLLLGILEKIREVFHGFGNLEGL